MNSDPGTVEGLRARKRAATQTALERAALDLALAHGYDSVTVDAICEVAMVSPRTFFNYFGTKEAVFLGASPPPPSEASIHAFVHAPGSGVLPDLVEMATSALVDLEPDRALLRARRQLIESTPELLARQIARIAEMENLLLRLVLDRFEAQGRRETSTPDLADEAHMVVALWSSVMRFSMHTWFSGSFTGSPRELLNHSMDLIGRIAGPERPPSAG